MTRGERAVVHARLEYGYAHPDCGLAAPPSAAADAALSFDLQLLTWWVPAYIAADPGCDPQKLHPVLFAFYKRHCILAFVWHAGGELSIVATTCLTWLTAV